MQAVGFGGRTFPSSALKVLMFSVRRQRLFRSIETAEAEGKSVRCRRRNLRRRFHSKSGRGEEASGNHAFPVLLVVRNSVGVERRREVRDWLREATDNGTKKMTQVAFYGERFDSHSRFHLRLRFFEGRVRVRGRNALSRRRCVQIPNRRRSRVITQRGTESGTECIEKHQQMVHNVESAVAEGDAFM